MNITDIRVRKVDNGGKLAGVASITIDDAFAVHEIKIIQGEKGLFVAMPNRKSSDGEYRDICHPVNAKVRIDIQNQILKAYEEAEE